MNNREQFEAWYLKNWGHTEDNHESLFERCQDGYGDEYYRLGVRMTHEAWQAASKASEQHLAAVVAESGQMLRLLTDISENHDEYVNADEYLYAGVPMDYVSEINAYISRDVDAENPFKETDAYQAEVRAQGVEMFASSLKVLGPHEHPYSTAAKEFAVQLRQGAAHE